MNPAATILNGESNNVPHSFFLAGVSASFSLKKRGNSAFIKERLKRLGIPLIFGIVFISPILSYVADKSHNGYKGNYFENYSVYFTKYTDLTGYDGGFTLGHFGFIAVLIMISYIGCGVIPLIDRISNNGRKRMAIINAVISLLAIASFEVTLFGKRIPTYLCVYLLGYYLFSQENNIKKILKLKWFFWWLDYCISNKYSIVRVYRAI